MRTIAEIVADLSVATDDQTRNALMDELAQARTAQQADPVVQLRGSVTEVATRRDSLLSEYETITTAAVDDNGEAREFTAEEAEKRGRLSAQIDQAKAEHTNLEDQLRQAIEIDREKRMDDKLAQVRRELGIGEGALGIGAQGIAGITEHRTYERGNGVSFLKDLAMSAFPAGAIGPEWYRSQERLQRHGHENHYDALELAKKSSRSDKEDYFVRQMVEQVMDRESAGLSSRGARQFSYEQALNFRALSTASSAGGEFVPPMYLTEEWIKFLRAGRVVADNQHHEDLPDGTMSINIPKVTSGVSVATQGTQNTNVSMTDLQTAFVTVPVVTKAGQQTVSLQLLERSPISFDSVVTGDLALAYAQNVDIAVINGPGSGDVTGILNTSGITTITWTQATPSAGGFYGRVGVGKRGIAQSIYLPATHLFTTPDCWEWLSQTLDGQNRPLVVPAYQGPFNALAVTGDSATAEGRVGRSLNGLATFEDANVPVISSDDVAIVSRPDMNYLYESPVINRALPQTYGAQLSVLLQLYGYIAFTAARYPTANAVITGTGMANPRTYNS